MATLEIQAPDGKTLEIEVPAGTDPSQYDQIVEDVIRDYSPSKVEAPQLSTGLQAMTGSMSPVGPSLLPKEAQVPYTTGEQAGQVAAEKLAESGHPYLAGTLLNVPAAFGAATAMGDVKSLASGVKALPSLLKKAPKAADDVAMAIPNIEKDLGQLGLRKASLKTRMLEARKAAEAELGKIKEGIQQYETSAGISPKKILEVPEGFEQTASKLASMTPKQLAETAPIETLQEWNKIASLARRKADPTSRTVYDTVKTLTTEAQDILKPGIKGLRESFSTAKKGIEAIPANFKAEEASLAEQIARKKLSLAEAKAMLPPTSDKESFAKKVLKLGLQSAVGTGAATAAWKLVK